MILSGLRSGLIQVWKNKTLVVILYLANLISALVLMVPFRSMIKGMVSNNLMGEKLGGRFDMDFFFELLQNQNISISTLGGLVMVVPLIYWLIQLFLSGGIFTLFLAEERYNPILFWGTAAKFFGRFLRLFLWSIPVFILLYCLQFIDSLAVTIIFGKDPAENIIFWNAWLRLALGYLGILIYFTIFDYARIHTIVADVTKTRKSLWYGIKFTFRNFSKTFSLSFILFLITIALLMLYNLISDRLYEPDVFILLALLIVQQLYMIFRTYIKISLYSGEIFIYKRLRALTESRAK